MTTIDLTDSYPGLALISRAAHPVRAIVVHHAAGYYLGRVPVTTTDEREEITRMAADHRTRFGVGPAYNYLAFPSGRLYAVGKLGRARAHAKGYNPETGVAWNVDAVSICATGNADSTPVVGALLAAIAEAIAEIRALPYAGRDTPVLGHGFLPTQNSAGIRYSQATVCPGRYLAALLVTLNANAAGQSGRVRLAATELEELANLLEDQLEAIRRIARGLLT